jgi:hypothetical protein
MSVKYQKRTFLHPTRRSGGHYAGLRPWATGLTMVAVGAAQVIIAIALGG